MWRSRIFWRLCAIYSSLAVLATGLLGWVLLGRLEEHLLRQTQQQLETKARLLGEIFCSQTMSLAERQQQVQRLAPVLGCRITVLAVDGAVLADSAEQPEKMENHLDRAEVQAAQTAGIGVATRYSRTIHVPLMYVACRVDAAPIHFVRLALLLGQIDAEMHWLQMVVLGSIAGTLAAVLLLSLWLAQRFSAPLVALAAAASRIAQGAYGERVLVPTHDEVGTLAEAFNEMSQACAVHMAQLDQDRRQLRAIFGSMDEGVLVIDDQWCVQFLNESAARLLRLPAEAAMGRKLWQLSRHRKLGQTVERILARDDRCQVELEWSGTEPKHLTVHGARLPGSPSGSAVLVLHDVTSLRRLERIRQDFVTNVSHELKTPLAGIQAAAETLVDGALYDPEHNVRFLQRIRENADRLARLVQDLLTLGRIESGQETLNFEPILLAPALEQCWSRHDHRAAAKALKLQVLPAAEPLTAWTDDDALAEILDNLVDNAIKYTPADGAISLRYYRENETAVIDVADTGVGIPQKDLPRIFERFYRVDKARSRELGGTGLGLSIVKHLVKALGGTISVSSQVGAGTIFTLRLPMTNPTESTHNLHSNFTGAGYHDARSLSPGSVETAR